MKSITIGRQDFDGAFSTCVNRLQLNKMEKMPNIIDGENRPRVQKYINNMHRQFLKRVMELKKLLEEAEYV
jgi:hypothetical protein